MTASADLVAVDLTADQRTFVVKALHQWRPDWSMSTSGKPFPFQALGLSSSEGFSALAARLADAVEHERSLSDLDWARTLLLTESCWGSSLIGLAPDFDAATGVSDADALSALRRIQRVLGGAQRANLLFDPRPDQPQA
jgi:hypothetical protein